MNWALLMETLPIASGVKLALATTGPIQSLLDRPGITHAFCNRQAIAILRNDGHSQFAALLEQYLPELDAGVFWADTGWKNVGHYYNPATGQGLWRFPSALEEFERYYEIAAVNALRRDWKKAFFYLGAATHLIQDVCVPHHVCGKVLDGHKQYEQWAEAHRERYAVVDCGLYMEGQPINRLLQQNAAIAADLLSWVAADSSKFLYRRATEIALPLAQRSTAGLYHQFAVLLSCMPDYKLAQLQSA